MILRLPAACFQSHIRTLEDVGKPIDTRRDGPAAQTPRSQPVLPNMAPHDWLVYRICKALSVSCLPLDMPTLAIYSPGFIRADGDACDLDPLLKPEWIAGEEPDHSNNRGNKSLSEV